MTDENELVGQPLEEVPQREPDDVCNGRRKESREGEIVRDDEGRAIFAGYCQLVAGWGTESDSGRCRKHGGNGGAPEDNDNAEGNDGGAREGNDNAVTHGAFQEHFTSNLTEGEQAAFTDAYNQLEDAHGAQDIARSAASICLLQFRRSGDERFLRRFEGICDKFEIAPAERLEVDVDEERSIDEEDKGEIVNAIESLRDGDD